nr:ribonuclease H-like domain-containing protein [Tanacetum cinerariifolium]
WAKYKITRRSIIGYSVFLGNSLVSWKSKKQAVVSRSSTEAEYKAMCNVCCEVLWIRKVLTDLQVNISLHVEMSCDNSSTIQIAANPVLHERSKHFEIDLYILREKIAAGFIKTKKVKSKDNIADLFTKGLTISELNKFYQTLGTRLMNGIGEHEARFSARDGAAEEVDSKSDSLKLRKACEASKKAIRMKNFIGDLGVVPTVQDLIEIFCDNESVVALTKEPKDHGKSNHIEIKYHFV